MTWPMVKIKNVASVITGKTPPKSSADNFDGDIPFITPAELGSDIYVSNSPQTLSEKGANIVKTVPKDAVMVCCIGSLGKLGIAAREVRTNQQINSVIFNKNYVFPKYGYYALAQLKPMLESIAPATTVAIVNKSNFESLEIPLPPFEEQKRIAAILDKADAIRQKRQQAITLADDFLRSVFLDMFGDPVTNPKGWEVIKLGSCCRFQGGFAFKSEDYCDSGIPLVKITNVHFENIDWSDVSYVPADFLDTKAEFALKDEDLVMAMTRPIIKSLNAVKVIEVKEMDLPCLLNQRVGRFIDYENSFKKHFLKYLLYSDFFMNEVEKLCSVALQPNISAKQIEAITCYIPPIELQDEFSQIAKQIEQTIPHMSSFNDLDLFGSLNSKAFSGQL
ncbi:restriction endonuclease subunit S [Aeromonas veronii]|uniref:restriction endonuclease subunit S n=1 Tax=Aeromonas veronii TaxID=654 RepID=UPI003D1E1B3A